MEPQAIILYGFLASFAAGMMTTVGAIPCLFIKKISAKFEDTTLGFAAGVMLGASFFSLIVPGLDYADRLNWLQPAEDFEWRNRVWNEVKASN